MPSFNNATLKLINKPTFQPPTFRYVNNWASYSGTYDLFSYLVNIKIFHFTSANLSRPNGFPSGKGPHLGRVLRVSAVNYSPFIK